MTPTMSMIRSFRGAGSDYSKLRISVCVPCRDMMHSAFAFDLIKLQEYNQIIGLTTLVHFHIGTLIVNQREQLVQMAKDAGSTHILWLDSDMMFPADTAQRLLKHNKPVVAANYVTRQYPHKTVAYRNMEGWNDYLVNTPDQGNALIPVMAVGMGCMLTEIGVFAQLARPYFETTWVPELNDHLGEDFTFCSKIRDAGHEVLIDNDLSLKISHLGTFGFTHNQVRTPAE